CDRLGLMLIEPETQILRPLAVVGFSNLEQQQWWAEQLVRERRLGQRMSAERIERLHQGEALIIDWRQPPWNEMSNPFNIHAMLIVPMVLGTQLLGLLMLDYGGLDHLYTSQEIALA